MIKLVVSTEFPRGSLSDCLLDGDKETASLITEGVCEMLDKEDIDEPSLEIVGNLYREMAGIMDCKIFVRKTALVNNAVSDSLK